MLTVKEEKTLKSEPESLRHFGLDIRIPSVRSISCLTAETTITASQIIEDIVAAMKVLWSEVSTVIFSGLDECQVLLDFNLEEMQQKLAELIAGHKMQHLLKLGEQFGLIYLDGGEFDLSTHLDDGLYIQIVRDELSRPLSLHIGLNNIFHKSSIAVDLAKFAERALMIKNNHLLYYPYSKEIWLDFKKVYKDIEKNPVALPDVMANFNAKWAGKVILSSKHNTERSKIKLHVKDISGNLLGWRSFEYNPMLTLHGFFNKLVSAPLATSHIIDMPETDKSNETKAISICNY